MMYRPAAERLADCERAIGHMRTVQLRYELDGLVLAAECAQQRIDVLLNVWQQLRALTR